MFGRFLEVAIGTADILASVQFYERLGFGQLTTGDAWPHRYGVLGDGRIYLGLHECSLPSPAPVFVLPGLEGAQGRLRAAGMKPELAQFSSEALHHVRLRDPDGNPLILQEARTFSPTPAESVAQSLCGYFLHAHMPLTSDQLDLAFHQRRSFDAPLLLFECADLDATRTRLHELGVALSTERPRGVDGARSIMLEAPEGTALLLVAAP